PLTSPPGWRDSNSGGARMSDFGMALPAPEALSIRGRTEYPLACEPDRGDGSGSRLDDRVDGLSTRGVERGMSGVALADRRNDGFERYYARHANEVYRFALSRLGDPHDAEDVTQATFLNAYRAFSRGHRPSDPRAWLLALARNLCYDRYRSNARRPAHV